MAAQPSSVHRLCPCRYVEMDNSTWLDSGKLNLTREIAESFYAAVEKHYPEAEVRWGRLR